MTANNMFPNKITAEHLQRRAVVYVRQSTDHQVRQNLESQRLQYGLVDRARALGWPGADVVDADLGVSAGLGAVRAGFDQVLAAVARGEVGIVLAREVSRLSRNDKDFCRMVELCQVFGTLLADAEQVYDPASMDDQLILGIKGTMSVVELRILRMRLIQGAQAKAARGELRHLLPSGFVYDAEGKIALDPDQRVRQAIAYVFQVFHETGSARQAMLRLQTEGVQVPGRNATGTRKEIQWHTPYASSVGNILRNPCYAGAYVSGRHKTVHRYENGRLQHKTGPALPLAETPVVLWDHHPGYITREQFEEHLRMMQRNHTKFEQGSPVRPGEALLVGVLRCGRCGRRLCVKYWTSKRYVGRYLCQSVYQDGGRYCVGVPGARLDKAVEAELLRVLTPLGVQASLAALEKLGDSRSGQHEALSLQVEQLAWQVRLAQERYEQVDARNRLVAAELERNWNAKLEALAQAQGQLAAIDTAPTTSIAEQRQAITALGEHFATAWRSSRCPMELKKRLVRAVIDEIIVDCPADTAMSVTIRWQGGAHTQMTVAKPSPRQAQTNSAEDVELIRQLAPRYTDDEIARVLARTGRVTGKGNPWNQQAVKWVRRSAGIQGGDKANRDPDLLSLYGAERLTGVSGGTIQRLVDAGLLINHQTIPWAPWEIRRQDLESEPVAGILQHLRRTGRLVLGPNRLENPAQHALQFQGDEYDV